jgi:hypothetical protein
MGSLFIYIELVKTHAMSLGLLGDYELQGIVLQLPVLSIVGLPFPAAYEISIYALRRPGHVRILARGIGRKYEERYEQNGKSKITHHISWQ